VFGIDGSKGEIVGEDAVDKVEAEPHRWTHQSIPVLAPKGHSSLLLFQLPIDLHNVQPHQIPLVSCRPHNVVRFDRRKASSELSASSEGNIGVDRIDVKGNMEGLVSSGVEVRMGLPHHLSNSQLSDVVHREALDVQSLQVYPFVRVDVPNGNEDHVFIGDLVGQPLEPRNYSQAGDVGDRIAVVVGVFGLVRVDEVGMSVNPDDLQVLIVGVQCVEGGRAHRMVSADGHHHSWHMLIQSVYDSFVDLSE
jgi:hypothetical protein